MSGMPKTHAAGCPTRAHARTAGRRADGVDAVTAAMLPGTGEHRREENGCGSHGASAQRRLATERNLAEQLVGTVGPERVHEGAGAHVPVGASDRVACPVRGASGERQ
jgi:hypothetical protein